MSKFIALGYPKGPYVLKEDICAVFQVCVVFRVCAVLQDGQTSYQQKPEWFFTVEMTNDLDTVRSIGFDTEEEAQEARLKVIEELNKED